MELSVVVPTLNGREQLSRTLDSLETWVPDAEVIVVNGPSADGTTGMVRERDFVDVLVEIADRTVNAARNAGFRRATGDVIAFVNQGLVVDEGWADAIRSGIVEAPVVTGPSQEQLAAGLATETEETTTVAGRPVTYFNGGNVAFEREVLSDLDGFDEQLEIGGARDFAHRVAGADRSVNWLPEMSVEREFGADGGARETDWDQKYRSLAYRLVKNYGPRPAVAWRLVAHCGGDALRGVGDVVRGDVDPSQWLSIGREVLGNVTVGIKDGLWARGVDRTVRRNPKGASTRADRAVSVYDRRSER